MNLRKWALRGMKWAGVSLVGLVVLLAALVQGQQWLLRWRAERLMADMHKIRLYQSNWADAQKLMYRWGKFGHWDGTCTAESCRYRIELDSLPQTNAEWFNRGLRHGGNEIFNLFGGRWAGLFVSFTVQDGIILRLTAGIRVTDSYRPFSSGDGYPLTLIVDTKSRQRVRQTRDDWWVMGDRDQLADHPYYIEGRPGGCEIACEEAVVTYSTRTPPGEIERLSAFNFACLTRIGGCSKLEELVPAAKEWKLYTDAEYLPRYSKAAGVISCDIPVWAIARDANYILSVVGVSMKVVNRPRMMVNPANGFFEERNDSKFDEARVRLLDRVKGTAPWIEGAVVDARPFSGSMADPHSFQAPEHLLPGKRYIVFPRGDDRKVDRLTKDSPMVLDRCGVWEDTPEVRAEIAKGMAMNDNLRGPERW